jgi:peptide chain release factor 1
MDNVFEKMEAVEARYDDLNRRMATPESASNPSIYQPLARELSSIAKPVEVYREYKRVLEDLAASKALLADPDPAMREMAREEGGRLDASGAFFSSLTFFTAIGRKPG